MKSSPTVSIVIPTLNAGRTLGSCLDAVISQDYARERIQIVIADAGSTDRTCAIVKEKLDAPDKKIRYKIVPNPLKTGEAGKAVGIKEAEGDIIALIDSDNIFENRNWLSAMVAPFSDPEIISSEPLYWTYRPEDSAIDRYCALTGINNPMCLFLGNYDRYSYLTDRWTDFPIVYSQDKGGYLKIKMNADYIPTMGANGFLIRKNIVDEIDYGDYYFDIDVVYDLIRKGHDVIARPKIGIIHLYCDNIGTFLKKQQRCIKDYLYYKGRKMRSYKYKLSSLGFCKFILYTVFVFPTLIQSFKGFFKKRDYAWFLHPLLCLVVLWVYAAGTVKSIFDKSIFDRRGWSQ